MNTENMGQDTFGDRSPVALLCTKTEVECEDVNIEKGDVLRDWRHVRRGISGATARPRVGLGAKGVLWKQSPLSQW